MHSNVKSFIEQHIDLIEQEKFRQLFVASTKTQSGLVRNVWVQELVSILNTIGYDTTAIRWELVYEAIHDYIKIQLNDPQDDAAHSWSRLNYMLDGIDLYGFDYMEVKNHIIDNCTNIGIECNALPLRYSWNDSPEYDIGWFNKQAYKEIYL